MEHRSKKRNAPTIQKSDLQGEVVKAIHKVLGGKDVFLAVLEKNIKMMLESGRGEQIVEIDRRLEEWQQEILRLEIGKKDYGDVADAIYKLREQW